MLFTKQVSVFLENRKGRLADVTRLLADEKINVRSLSMADMADLGVLRIIVDDRVRCMQALRAKGFIAQETDVIAAEIEDKPGGLHRVIEVLGLENVNIEYMYTFFEKNSDKAIVVLRINDCEGAVAVLQKHGIGILPGDRIQQL